MEALLASSTPAVEKCMKPQFIRLAPPLHIAEDEVRYQIYMYMQLELPPIHNLSILLYCFIHW